MLQPRPQLPMHDGDQDGNELQLLDIEPAGPAAAAAALLAARASNDPERSTGSVAGSKSSPASRRTTQSHVFVPQPPPPKPSEPVPDWVSGVLVRQWAALES